MTKIKLLIFSYLLATGSLWACPGCAGSMDNPRDLTYIYVLAGFIALIYIPFFIIFRVIKKNKDSNLTEQEALESDLSQAEKPS